MPQIEVSPDVAEKLNGFKLGIYKTDNDVIGSMVDILPAQSKRIRELTRRPGVSNSPAGMIEVMLRDLEKVSDREAVQELFSGVRESLTKLAGVGPGYLITAEWHEQVYKPALANAIRTFEAIGVALERSSDFPKPRH